MEEGNKEGKDKDEEDYVLCSVLSTVVSQVMTKPTPLTPLEFELARGNPKQPLQVPVLRVFGPIIRGDAPSGAEPVQSACLYIHGKRMKI